MAITSYEELDNARKLLGLAEITSCDEIKKMFHQKIKEYHPDANQENNDAHWKTIEIMQAYELVIKYCQQYQISFKQEAYVKQNCFLELSSSSSVEYHQWWMNMYGNDPIWGNGEPNESV